MSVYNIVPNAIGRLADRVGGMSESKARHQERMGTLALSGAQIDLDRQTLAGQNKLAVASAERESLLDKPTTFKRVIETSDMPAEQKKQILSSFDDKVLNFPTTRRRAFEAFQTLESEKAEAARAQAERESREGIATGRNEATLEATRMRTASDEKIAADRNALHLKVAGMKGGGKTQSVADKKYQAQIAADNIMGKYGVKEGLNGGLESPEMTKEQAEAMMAEAAQAGLNIYFDETTVKDTGSGWNPFDNKDVPAYVVRAVVPGGDAQMAMPQETTPQQAPTQTQQIFDQLLQQANAGQREQAPAQPAQAQPEAPAAEPAPEPLGNLSSGVQFGRSKTQGYVVIEGDVVRKPTPEEAEEIKLQALKGGATGGGGIQIPRYTGPEGGYFNPEHYSTGR